MELTIQNTFFSIPLYVQLQNYTTLHHHYESCQYYFMFSDFTRSSVFTDVTTHYGCRGGTSATAYSYTQSRGKL